MTANTLPRLRGLAVALMTALGLAACAADHSQATNQGAPEREIERERGGM